MDQLESYLHLCSETNGLVGIEVESLNDPSCKICGSECRTLLGVHTIILINERGTFFRT